MNVIIPILNLYAKIFNDNVIKENTLIFYNSHKTSSANSIVKLMLSQLHLVNSLKPNTTASEQGIIHLYNFYCIRQKCSACDIGKIVFKEGGYEYRIIYY